MCLMWHDWHKWPRYDGSQSRFTLDGTCNTNPDVVSCITSNKKSSIFLNFISIVTSFWRYICQVLGGAAVNHIGTTTLLVVKASSIYYKTRNIVLFHATSSRILDNILSINMIPNHRKPMKLHTENSINSSPPSAAYMRQWNGATLVQMLASRQSHGWPSTQPGSLHTAL